MRKLILVLGLVVVAIACGETAGEILTDAGQTMMDAGDAMTPDADAQVDDCPCDAGPQGEPGLQGEQGDPGPRGEPGPSGIVSATSFIPANNPIATQVATWVCEFGGPQLAVEEDQRLLITGQGTARFAGTGSGYGEAGLAVGWRKSGETAVEVGHAVDEWADFPLTRLALHVTELTSPLAAGAYDLGICVRKGRADWDSVTITSPYGTAMVIN